MTYARSVDFPPAEGDQDDENGLNLTSTSYVSPQPRCETRFRAPSSGKVLVTVGGGVRDNSNANRVYLAAEVIESFGDGDTVFSAGDLESAFSGTPEGSNYMYGSRTLLVSGLDPGWTYIARVLHRVDGGSTADYQVREIIVEAVS